MGRLELKKLTLHINHVSKFTDLDSRAFETVLKSLQRVILGDWCVVGVVTPTEHQLGVEITRLQKCTTKMSHHLYCVTLEKQSTRWS